jgi:hypothetical protein
MAKCCTNDPECLKANIFDAVVQQNKTEAEIYEVDADMNLGRNRDLQLGELPSESDADPDRKTPYVKRIDCANCGDEADLTKSEWDKLNGEKIQ